MSAIAVTLDELLALRSEAALLAPLLDNVNAVGAGNTRIAPTRSRGMEYAESRVYSPGDDARRIDWRVTARRGETHLKLFHEQRDRYVALGVDFGATMAFATRGSFKSVVAARAAAVLTFALQSALDHVTLAIERDAGSISLDCGPGRQSTATALCELLVAEQPRPQRQPAPAKSAAALCANTLAVRPDAGLLILISDFYDIDELFLKYLREAASRCAVLMIWTVDPLEIVLPRATLSATDGRHTLEIGVQPSDERHALAKRRLARLTAATTVPGVACVSVATDDDSVPAALRAAVAPGARVARYLSASKAPGRFNWRRLVS